MNASETTDEEVARMVQKGNSQSFGVLMERYQAKLLRYATKFLSDTEDRKDLVQEVFTKAYINIQSFDIHRKFSSWIYRIAHNEFVNALKKKGSFLVLPIDLDILTPHLISSETADKDIHTKDTKKMLDQFLGSLDPKYREPLVLHYFEDMSYKEIADVLHIPTSTVGIRIRRGKLSLKKMMPHG